MSEAVHLNLDDAWPCGALSLPVIDARTWGPRLRYCAGRHDLQAFDDEVSPRLGRYILYGSGDFHHLAVLWMRRVHEPFAIVSFDNHPDWDRRPPWYGCGSWISRALEIPNVQHVSVWGCGNFELDFPHRFWGNMRMVRAGRLVIRPWSGRVHPRTRTHFDCITADAWREQFDQFARELAGTSVYVTVDLDCLRADEAVTNWENGLFSAADVAWAVGRLREATSIIGGDVCGAWSRPIFSRWVQRLLAAWDHPALRPCDPAGAQRINAAALLPIWQALTGGAA